MTDIGTPDSPLTDPGNTTTSGQSAHKDDDLKPVPPSDVVNLGSYILDEIAVMTEHALDVGVSIPDSVAQNLQSVQGQIEQQQRPCFEVLISIHNALSVLILPALPGSLLFLKKQRKETIFGAQNLAKFLGPIPIIRHMVIVSFFALAAFIYLSVSSQINAIELGKSLFERDGFAQVSVSLFLLSAAAIGGSFANLYKAYQFVDKGTFDPNNNTTYWINFALGLIAGFVLSELVSLDVETTTSRPLLALLGGFSANAVYKILSKLVEAVGAVVEGDAAAQVAASQASIRANATEQNLQIKTQLANNLIAAKSKLVAAGVPAEALNAEFEALMKQTLSSS
ncbi:hypothetical protein [Magnetovibrio blakemorei]|uniref:Uncharacterized protein n=1 Tax=Magnetovibrio blakemorei TaxID=28181 RepID=A0A1E5QAP0_9PROT|nr:hypothetical protein [Magnetovibrio blakemorei]OEJ68911.1 hypothetical protein BEN30_05220 [Magnetovibrio blakemorei]